MPETNEITFCELVAGTPYQFRVQAMSQPIIHVEKLVSLKLRKKKKRIYRKTIAGRWFGFRQKKGTWTLIHDIDLIKKLESIG